MYRKLFNTLLILLTTSWGALGQQFIGMPVDEAFTTVQQIPYNPAWVNSARTGVEVNLFGLSIFAGNNAYGVTNKLIFDPGAADGAVENKDYFKLKNTQNKKAWANMDILGPSASFTYKKMYQFGVYTRFRTIVSAGNVASPLFDILTDDKNPEYYNFSSSFEKSGVSAQAFGELGFTAGQMLRDDEYKKISVGVTIKYLMGFAGISVYTKSLAFDRNNDSLGYLKGDLTAMYTYNTNPSSLSELQQRAGKGSLGLDIGGHYEFYEDSDPNKKTPYKFSLAASITDIGAVSYVADKGSGLYAVNTGATQVKNLSLEDEDKDEFSLFTARKQRIGELTQQKAYEKFNIGLPTAFRVNFDYNMGSKVYIAVNTLLNLKGNNGKVFKPGYANYLNITPRYDMGKVKVSIPITFMRYKVFAMGSIFNLGPFYLGSSTSLSSLLLGSNITNIDVYTGFTFKIPNKEKKAREYMFDYRGVDDPNNNSFRRLIPRFLRRKQYY